MKARGLGGCSCWEVRAERGEAGTLKRSRAMWRGVLLHAQWNSECAAGGRHYHSPHCSYIVSVSLTSHYSSVFCSHIRKKLFLSSCILVKLGQNPYDVLLNRHTNNWFMLYGITHSSPPLIFVETEGPVSVSSQVNCKWVPTSGLQYAAWLHTSTNRRLPGLTVTKQLHTLTQPLPEALRCDSTTEDKRMGSIWPGITAFKKKKNGTVKRICMTAPRNKQHGNGIPAKTTLIWC